ISSSVEPPPEDDILEILSSRGFGFFELFFLHYAYEKYNDKVGYAFLAIGIIKMALSISFLMPLITSNLKDKIPDTLNFFFCYFVFLIIESVILVKLLSKKQ
ncbi:MAG TPA: hypothetical protein DDZ41_11120, partial [Flavobacterium sp.]|nr:hypothetical protein [Flavobacterium sp.]